MTDSKQIKGGDVFIVDNSELDWKVRRYLYDWIAVQGDAPREAES